jgi:CHAD domain-containing protein
MGVISDGKWFSVDPVGLSVVEAAYDMLAQRLADVQDRLPTAAAAEAADVEAVHQLRVACRRASAAVRAYRPLVDRSGNKLRRWLKRLRRAAGPARDADVLLARLRRELDLGNASAQSVLKKMQKTRAKAQRRLNGVYRKARRGGLDRAIERCLRALRRSDGKRVLQPFGEFARSALQHAAEDFVAYDADDATASDLHQLRIAAKRLRYSLELFHSAVDARVRDQGYPLVEELQDRLGTLNDRVAAQALFQSWLAEAPPDELGAFTAGLIVTQHADAERLHREFLDWWLPERRSALLDCLDSIAR